MVVRTQGRYQLADTVASPKFRGFLSPCPQESPPTNKHQRAPYEETDVPINPLILRHGFVDVVNTQQVMIDDAFNQIKTGRSQSTSSPRAACRTSAHGVDAPCATGMMRPSKTKTYVVE